MTWAILLKDESQSCGNNLPRWVGGGVILPPLPAAKRSEARSTIEILHCRFAQAGFVPNRRRHPGLLDNGIKNTANSNAA
jgi:hypothetical protein